MRGRGPQRSNRVLNIEEQILNATEENPGLSTRQWVVSRTLHEQLLYPCAVVLCVVVFVDGFYKKARMIVTFLLEF
jgi:hypothetical protein